MNHFGKAFGRSAANALGGTVRCNQFGMLVLRVSEASASRRRIRRLKFRDCLERSRGLHDGESLRAVSLFLCR